MNVASFLLCLVFAAIGYVIQPMILPKLVDSNLVSKSALSDKYKEEQAKKLAENTPKPVADAAANDLAKVDASKMDNKPKPVEPTPPTPPKPVEPEVVVTPIPAPTIPDPVTPEPEKTAPETGEKLTDQQLVEVIEASVKAGGVKEFAFDQVLEWNHAGVEQIDGESYQVGMITYKADTIFDEQELKAKALIKGGKVVKWLWPTTNTEMR